MAKGDEFAGLFGCQDSSEPGGGQDITFGHGLGLNETEGFFLDSNLAASDGFAQHDRLGRNIHHAGFASGVYVS